MIHRLLFCGSLRINTSLSHVWCIYQCRRICH